MSANGSQSTITDVESTFSIIRTSYPRETITSTTTTTVASYVYQKRQAPVMTPPAVLPRDTDAQAIAAAVGEFLTDNSTSNPTSSASIFSALSSACECAGFGPFYTVNLTLTDYTVVSYPYETDFA